MMMVTTKAQRTMNRRRIVHLLAYILMATPLVSSQTFRLSLDGEWLFAADPSRTGVQNRWPEPGTDRSGWQKVVTPKFWEEYPKMANYDGWGWFARTFLLEKIAGPLSIHCAGVDDEAVVWVNGTPVGEHTGYSDPFILDVSAAVRKGENLVVVLVKDNSGGGGIYRPVTLVDSAQAEHLLHGPYASRPARISAPWVKDAAIYSVYLRSFSPEGTFAGLERRLPELKKLGVTVLWLLPVHPVGKERRKGTLGSPYAVRDYYGINPEFGTLEDFKRLLAAAHAQGMKLIIDLVANHTSWDSELMKSHPEWFTRDAGGKIVPPNADWTDVADLDYAQQGLRDYMIEMMRWWVEDVGIDGFRCDVAEMVPTDFWEEARARLDRIRPVMMLSEGSLPEHHLAAFDLTYSWNVYDALDPLLNERRPVALLDQILRTEDLQFPRGALRMRFTTNHDKNAWDAPAVTKFGPDGLRLAVVLVNTLPGIPMIYTGEEVANKDTLSLFEKVGVDWKRSGEMGELWRTMFALRKSHAALREGSFRRVRSSDEGRIFAFVRTQGTDRVLVVLNFGKASQQVKLDVGGSGLAGTLRDLLGDGSFEVRQGRLVVNIGARGWALLAEAP
jgi:glycosidase